MKEFLDILEAIPGIDRPMVLATLVSVRGSTYRRPGARMLVVDGERRLGTISGGCLEAEVCRRAGLMRPGQPAELVEFDTLDDDDVLFGYSMGCKGVIRILLQPIPPASLPSPLEQITRLLRSSCRAAMATIFTGPNAGTQFLCRDDEIPSRIDQRLFRDCLETLRSGRFRNRKYDWPDGQAEVFIEPVLPAVRLLMFGGGLDAVPVARLSQVLGWEIIVVDPRERQTIAARFPEAKRIIESAPAAAARDLSMNERTAALLITHNYAQDLELLRVLLSSPPGYIGMLGPRHRTQRLFAELREQGALPSGAQLTRLHTPAGLDIGTNHPEEIALAIVAEIQAVMSGRTGGFLRDRTGDIHDQPEGA